MARSIEREGYNRMSKIAFFGVPAHGHVNPILPIIRELVHRGEQTIVYNTEEFRGSIEQVGATFRAYPATELTSARLSDLVRDGNLARVSLLLLRVTGTLMRFALDEVNRERPDLVVMDALAMWGRVASTLLNVPAVATIPHFITDERLLIRKAPRALLQVFRGLPQVPGIVVARARLARRFGAAFPAAPPLFPVRGGLNLVFTTRSLHPDTPIIDETFRFVGPSIDLRAHDEEFPFAALGRGPIVYVSLGTVHHGQIDFYRQCFDVFGRRSGQFILSIGRDTDVAALGPIPPNFIVLPHVPQIEVLERADAFITHGGMNSIHEGLYFGVPMVLIPQQLEQLFGSLIVAEHGAGVVIDDRVTRGRIDGARLAHALDLTLAEPRFREAARVVQKLIRAAGGYIQATDEIQAYLANR